MCSDGGTRGAHAGPGRLSSMGGGCVEDDQARCVVVRLAGRGGVVMEKARVAGGGDGGNVLRSGAAVWFTRGGDVKSAPMASWPPPIFRVAGCCQGIYGLPISGGPVARIAG